MVKENPRILARRRRRRILMEKMNKQRSQTQNENPIKPQRNPPVSSSSSSPPLPIHPLKSSPSFPRPSPPKFSLSSPEPTSKKPQLVESRSFSDPKSPKFRRALPRNPPLLGQLPPLPPPPPPSPQLLRRAVSDPASFKMPISDSKVVKLVSKNLGKTNQVFDEITNDESVHGCASKTGRNYTGTCSTRKVDDDGRKMKTMRDRFIGAERIEGDWTMIKINCPCGSDYQLLISEVEKKCYYKLV